MGKERRDEIPKRFVEMCSGLYMKLYTKNPTKSFADIGILIFLPLGKVHTKLGH